MRWPRWFASSRAPDPEILEAAVNEAVRKAVGDSTDDWVSLNTAGFASDAGVDVTPTSALGDPTVYAAVKALSEDLAKVPPKIYSVMYDDQGREIRTPAVAHALWRVLLKRPNQWQSPFEFKEYIEACRQLRGNAYSFIVRNGRGAITELIPLRPDRVAVLDTVEGEIFYSISSNSNFEAGQLAQAYRANGGREVSGVVTVPAEYVWHIRGFPNGSGLLGVSAITAARDAIGLSLAQQKYAGRMVANSARPAGVITHPGRIHKDVAKRLRTAWDSLYRGADNAGKTAVLEEGMDFKPISMNSVDAQFVEQRKLSVLDIARIFRVPPTKLMDTSRSTYSNAEQEALAYLTDSLMPLFERWESSMDAQLLTPREQGRYSIQFDIERLQRGDVVSRYRAYASGRQWGILTANEARGRDGLNPVEDGDTLLEPLNMAPMGEHPDPGVGDAGGQGGAGDAGDTGTAQEDEQ